MNKRVVITGINGFVGQHLARELSKQNVDIIGISQDAALSKHIEAIISEYHGANLITEWPPVKDVDAIIHLAGLVSVSQSFEKPQLYITANSSMTTNLCEFYMTQNKKPRIISVSSGAIYSPDQPMPITEESKIGFSSPYAISKILTENQGDYYRRRGLECVIARPFNHTGPGQALGFILPDLYKRLSEAKPGSTIRVGNLATKRDYTDVRDIVSAYAKLALAPALKESVYNVCSGKSVSGQEILAMLQQIMNKTDINIEVDPALVRPTDIMDIYGDSSRLRNELQWQPKYTLNQTIQDFVTDAQKTV